MFILSFLPPLIPPPPCSFRRTTLSLRGQGMWIGIPLVIILSSKEQSLADLVNNHHAQQLFIPSPPYTPYPSPTKDHTTPAPYTNYPTPCSSGHPSPVRTIWQSLSPSETNTDGQFGSPPPHTSITSTAASSLYPGGNLHIQ